MITINREIGISAYRQIYQVIRSDIEKGVLKPGAKLPAIRELAKDLSIARNTVESAYKQLSIEGYATGRRGVGYTVENLDFSVLEDVNYPANLPEERPDLITGLGRNPLGDDFGCTYDFSYGNRSATALPLGIWRALSNEVLTRKNMAAAASYMDPYGLPGLRAQLAKHLRDSRDVNCTTDQIILQPGTQPALQNIVELFECKPLRIAMEDPGYYGARAIFQKLNCDMVPIPTYKDPATFVSFLKASGAKLAFVTPSNQFPLGSVMPLSARLQVIEWARKHEAYIIEDDSCCEYYYDSRPVPSLHSLDPNHVIYLGTLSKILSPAIRLSYGVLPKVLLNLWNEIHGKEFCAVPWITQEILRLFMAKGLWKRYTHATTSLYRKRHDVLMDSVNSELGKKVKVLGAGSGLHIILGDGLRRCQKDLIHLARQNDVRVYETSTCWMNEHHPMDNYVIVGFSLLEDSLIPKGIRRLRRAWYE